MTSVAGQENTMALAQLRDLDQTDLPRLADFNSAFPGDNRTKNQWLDRLNHLFCENPYTDRQSEIGWGLELPDGSIVGCLLNIPLPFSQNGRETIVSAAATWRVLEPYRDQSMLLMIRQLRFNADRLLFDTTAGGHVLELINRLGFVRFPRGARDSTFVAILRGGRVATALKPRLGRLIEQTGLADLAAAALLWIRVRRSLEQGWDVRLMRPGELKSLDLLWGETNLQVPLTNLRSSKFFDWYLQHPFWPKQMIGAFRNGKLMGYAVFSVTEWRGMQVLECLDLWWNFNAESPIPSLVAALIDQGRSLNVDLVLIQAFSSQLRDTLRKTGLLERPYGNRPEYLRVGTRFHHPVNDDTTYFTRVQGDYSI